MTRFRDAETKPRRFPRGSKYKLRKTFDGEDMETGERVSLSAGTPVTVVDRSAGGDVVVRWTSASRPSPSNRRPDPPLLVERAVILRVPSDGLVRPRGRS